MDITRNNIELFKAVSCRSHTSQSNIFYVRKRGQSQHTPKVHPAQKLRILLVLLVALAKGGSKLEATTAQLARKPQGSMIHQENMELCRRVNIMSQQKMELHRKLQASEQRDVADANTSSSTPYSFSIAHDADVPSNLEQIQSHQKEGENHKTGAPELGKSWKMSWRFTNFTGAEYFGCKECFVKYTEWKLACVQATYMTNHVI
ncbi:MADS-box transcription factor 57-like [Panicum miliaceum]|uniref:MADS-box transcription factor 57-like n=1 Tax=Panicum miliaceum TaxID=4540 RepID=A0A3L6QJE9_PANMI|nr:MADS-box transcription factor 57-like [Panicum miliaceum]